MNYTSPLQSAAWVEKVTRAFERSLVSTAHAATERADAAPQSA
jgi:hypothetical protein